MNAISYQKAAVHVAAAKPLQLLNGQIATPVIALTEIYLCPALELTGPDFLAYLHASDDMVARPHDEKAFAQVLQSAARLSALNAAMYKQAADLGNLSILDVTQSIP